MTIPTFQLADVPGNFALCLNGQCPLADQCLHHIVRTMVPADQLILHVFNPEAVPGGSDCQFFRERKLDRYAVGFTQMQAEMKPRQYAIFSGHLQAHWGRNPYYERRSGKRWLPPVEQDIVRSALRHAGMPEDLEFDHYELRINWTE